MREGTVSPNGDEVRRRRLEKGWTQEKLAAQVGCSKRTIENVEVGKPVYIQTLAEIAQALGETTGVRSLLAADGGQPPRAPETAALRRFGNAPSLPSLLIGRQQALAEIGRRLMRTAAEGSPTQALTIMRGWPGVGKTTIARAVAYQPQVTAAFPDGVLWASLGPKPSLFAELLSWGRALLDKEVLAAADVAEAGHRLAGLLRDRRMLLIVDDVWEAAHVVPFLVGGPHCAMLVTTRLNRVAEELAPKPADIYRLDVLGEHESLELLETLAPQVVQEHREACRELVRQIEGLPLALQVAGRLLRAEHDRGWDAPRLLHDLKEDAARLLKAQAPADAAPIPGEVSPTVAALLRRSTDCLEPDVRKRFAYLAPFAPRPATFELEDLMSVWKVDYAEARRTVDLLVDRGLLEPVGGGEYQVHRILVEHAKTLLKKG